ncbi:MAG: class I SAM-dependent methyltransferase [Candidatus Aminicenantes bacterium]|nr:class I SAM-dependent methyltransferase [Candidatus Aminicenantes bacterium]
MNKFNKYLYYDFIEGYDQTINSYVMHYEEMMNAIFNELPNENLKVLEMGCGSGNLTKKISEKRNLKITGVDISERLIANAQKKLDSDSRLDLRVGNILEVDLQSTEFDYIISFLFIHELYPDQREELIKKIKVWSKKKTKIIIGDIFNIEEPDKREECILEWYNWMVNRGIKTVDALKEIEVHIRDSLYTSFYLTNLLGRIDFLFSKLLWSQNFYKVMVFEQGKEGNNEQ